MATTTQLNQNDQRLSPIIVKEEEEELTNEEEMLYQELSNLNQVMREHHTGGNTTELLFGENNKDNHESHPETSVSNENSYPNNKCAEKKKSGSYIDNNCAETKLCYKCGEKQMDINIHDKCNNCMKNVIEKGNFISSIQNRRPIWDQKDINHRNMFLLNKLWKQVAIENKMTVKKCREKWIWLRNHYNSERRRIKKYQFTNEAKVNAIAQQPQFKALDFLRVNIQSIPRKRVRNEEEELDIINHAPIPTEQEQPDILVMEGIESSVSSDWDREKTRDDNEKCKERNRKQQISEDDRQFFESVLPFMFRIPPERKMAFRIRCMQFLQDEIRKARNNS